MKRPLLLFLLILIGAATYIIIAKRATKGLEKQLQEAYSEYVKGEKAQTIGERKKAFNRALTLYTDIEKEADPTFGNGELYYDIANSYFQLGQYPLAVYYYYRAFALMPRSEKVAHNLEVTLGKLELMGEEDRFVFSRIFPFHHYFSLPERLQIFFGLAVLTFLLHSLYLWNRQAWQKKASIFVAVLTGVIFLSLGYSHYIAPIEGVILRSTSLYRDAGEQYAKVRETPILSGNRVKILDVLQEGRWLKVMTASGDLGYIPHEAVRIL